MDYRTTVISVNYKTPVLIEQCFRSFRFFYPHIPFILVDNGSDDRSIELLSYLREKEENVELILHRGNKGHGAGLDHGARKAATKFIFTIDSDCFVYRGDFLEKMLPEFEKDPLLFALGDTGIIPNHPELSYCHPRSLLMDREKYLKCPPFEGSGAPAMKTLRTGQLKFDFHVSDFPINNDYIHHFAQGTRSRHHKAGQQLSQARRRFMKKVRKQLERLEIDEWPIEPFKEPIWR